MKNLLFLVIFISLTIINIILLSRLQFLH